MSSVQPMSGGSDTAEGLTLKQKVGRWLLRRLPVSRFLFDQIRLELNAARVRAANRVLPWRRHRLRTIRARRGLRVNVACGPFPIEGFLNLDLFPSKSEIVPWDCRRRLPVSDEAAEGIRVEHFLEHLDPRQEVPVFLDDCRRALRTGGVLRIIVPDAERFLRAYCRCDLAGFRELAVPDPFPEDLPTRMDVVNHAFHQWHEHRWGYDFETLRHRLERAGFRRVARAEFRSSLDSLLAEDRAEHAPYSLYVDAVK